MDTEPGTAVDEPVLLWLSREALPGAEIVHTRPLAGGYRNDNILLVTGTGHRYVLRGYRHDNACAVEAALAARLAGVVPVAEVIAADAEGASAGRPVMLSRFMPGDPLSTALPGLSPRDAAELGRSAGTALAAIGTVVFPRPGFFDGPDLNPGADGVDPTAGLPDFVERCLRTDNAHHALDADERRAFQRHASEVAPALAVVRGSRRLVHSDFNPKNLLAARRDGTWTITAVLDWEFAFSSSPLFDVGNMLRFHDELPPAFADGFVTGYDSAGGHLPGGWREISRALDLFALSDFLTRPPGHAFVGKAAERIRALLRQDRFS